jgi:Co/Zn/Cd efflux system component
VHALTHTRSANWVLKLALVATEFVAGALAGSLALLSDGWHNFTDVPTLALTWIALYFAELPPGHWLAGRFRH